MKLDGHRVVIVGDGEATVAATLAGSFDVGLMDVQMPKMEGLKAAGNPARRTTDRPPHVDRCND